MRGIRWAVIGALALGGGWAEARKISFAPAQSFSSAVVNPACAATVDFNGDGKPDLVVTNRTGSVAVFLGSGDGTFMPPTLYTLDFYYAGCVAVGDFNGDGRLDMVVNGGDTSMNALALFTGNGDGTFNPPAYSMAAPSGTGISMALGDLNNDHNLDIFIGGNGSSEVVLGDGKGGFQAGFLADGVSGFGVVLGDFNGDGNLDVAATNFPSQHQVSILLGNGDGTFQAPQDYHAEFGATGIATGDFNGDQKLDLAVAAGYVLIFLGNGDGTFTSAGEWGYTYPTGSIVTADFNKDGELDLAVSSYNRPRVEALTGKGDGTFSLSAFFPTGTNPICVVTADLNNDGSPDLAVANYGSSTVSILLNAAGTKLPLRSSLNPSTSGQPVTFTVGVVGSVTTSVTPTGTVVFRDGSTVLGSSPVNQGKASFATSGLAMGKHEIFAVYSGDTTFNPNISHVLVQTVN